MPFEEPLRSEREWTHAVVNELQRMVAPTLLLDPAESIDELTHLSTRLPHPRSYAERLILKGLLFDYASRSGCEIHRHVHVDSAMRCRLREADLLGAHFGPETQQDPVVCFLSWAGEFRTALTQAHPVSRSQRVAALLRANVSDTIDIATIATQLQCSTAQLHREFRCEFGLSVRKYRERVRLLAAMQQLDGCKVEPIAMSVGYKTKKNFYRAFRALTGLTPKEFASLPEVERAKIVSANTLLGSTGEATLPFLIDLWVAHQRPSGRGHA